MKIRNSTPKVVVDELVTRKIAAITLTNPNVSHIARELRIPRHRVQEIMESPRFKAILEEMGKEYMAAALGQARQQMLGMIQEGVRVVKHHLSKNSLEAAKIVFKSVGIESAQDDKGRGHEAPITIIMPGAEPPKPDIEPSFAEQPEDPIEDVVITTSEETKDDTTQ